MMANHSGVQLGTLRKIGLAWVLTLPAAILLSAGLFFLGGVIFPETQPTPAAKQLQSSGHPDRQVADRHAPLNPVP
jgi:hypothetical protein